MEKNGATPAVNCSRDFKVPVSQLYMAWTDEAALKQWWHPNGSMLEKVTADMRPGGAISYVFAAQHGEPAIEIEGTYSTVQPEQQLEYSWNWKLPETDAVGDASFVLSVTFSPTEGGSRLEVTQTGFTGEANVQPHQEGWQQGLDALQAYVEGTATSGNQ